MIVCICDWFDRPNDLPGREFIINYCLDADTLKRIPMPAVHPKEVGAVFDEDINEWIIKDENE